MAIRMESEELYVMEADDQRWLTRPETAIVLDMSDSGVRRLCDAGILEVHRLPGGPGNLAAPLEVRTMRRIPVSSIRALIRRMGDPPRALAKLDEMVAAKWIEGDGRRPRKRGSKGDAE